MPLLADGREGDAAGRGAPGDSRAIPVADDFPDLQRLRDVAVQEDRAGHPHPWRGPLETCDAPAAFAVDWRGDVARIPRVRARRGVPRPLARRQTWRTAVRRSGRLAEGIARRLRTRLGRQQIARAARLRTGESFF